jgi:ATP-dependent helicase/nuclease subunit B
VAIGDWLWERKDRLPGMMIVVPTAQSGRRLRQGLAERGGILGPQVVTSGFLMRPDEFASEPVEILAWVETLEAVTDWDRYEAIFPVPPGEGEGAGWALGLAKSLTNVRTSLQENGLMCSSAARVMEGSLEEDRWAALAELEVEVERRLGGWGYVSKNARLAKGAVTLPVGVEQVIIAGVLDLPTVTTRMLKKSGLQVSVLLAGTNEDDFDEWGRPVPDWIEREIDWPENGSVILTGDPRQQAELALRHVAEEGCYSDDVALGTGDEEVSGELVGVFGRSGWVIHDPGAAKPSPIAGWLSCWRHYLLNNGVAEAIDLLALTQSGIMAKGKRAGRLAALSQLRDQWLVRSADDITRACDLIARDLEQSTQESKTRRLTLHQESAELGAETMANLEQWRGPFLGRAFHGAMQRLLKVIDPDEESGAAEWLDSTAAAAKQVKRSAGFWIELLLGSLDPVPETAPEDRVLDVQGWLELLHQSASLLVVCGMNEGKIPGRASSDTWLSEATRVRLGLAHNAARAARDAYLLTALMKSREKHGRVHLIVGKTSVGGDVLTPSRLLLSASGQELARRVAQLFEEVEPADAGLAWAPEDRWLWRPRAVEPKDRLSVTAIAKYLACPFRYYLERVVGMNQPEPERAEWNSRDFGTVVHEILERWGRDQEARDFEESEAIEVWVHQCLNEVVAERFGANQPLAVGIQAEAIRQRLTWFAQTQSLERSQGWRVVDVEKDFSIEIEGVTLTGQVDRIDQNDDGRIRVLDYKTSKKAKKVIGEHVKNLPKVPPAHLDGVEEVLTPDGKMWTNVQVPFYAAALERVDEVGYFALGETETDVRISLWDAFGDAEKDSAVICAKWVIGKVRDKVFWPPAAKPRYDDFEGLSFGRPLSDAIVREGGVV